MSRKRHGRREKDDEPAPDLESDEWIEWGGEFYLPVGGFTTGGAPIGLTYEQYQATIEESEQSLRAVLPCNRDETRATVRQQYLNRLRTVVEASEGDWRTAR